MGNGLKLIIILVLNICFIFLWKNKNKMSKNKFVGLNIFYGIIVSEWFIELLRWFKPIALKVQEVEIWYTLYLGLEKIKVIGDIRKVLIHIEVLAVYGICIAFITAIYIYILGIKNKTKKHILSYLVGHGNMFYLGLTLVSISLLSGKKELLLGGIGYLIFLLLNSVKWLIKINSKVYLKTNFIDVLQEFRGERITSIGRTNNQDVIDLYLEAKSELYEAIKDEDYLEVDESYKYFNLILFEYFDEVIGEKDKKENKYEIIKFLVVIYNLSLRNKNNDIFGLINQLHFRVANHFYNRDDKNFYSSLSLITKVYEYYNESKDERFAYDTLSYMEGFLNQISKDYSGDFEEALPWYSQCFKAISDCTEKVIGKNDLYFMGQIFKLIEINTTDNYEIGDKEMKNLYLLEASVYFEILLFLDKDHSEEQEWKEIVGKKVKGSLNSLEVSEVYILMSFYLFLEKYRISTHLNWDRYFFPKGNIIGGSFGVIETRHKVDEVFLELLAGYPLEIKSESEIDETEKKIQADFAKKAGVLLNRLNNFKCPKKWKLRKFLAKLEVVEKENWDNEVQNLELSNVEVDKTKETLKGILEESKFIGFLKKIRKYTYEKASASDIKLYGINKLYPKRWFVESERVVAYEHNIKRAGEVQNNGVDFLFIDSLKRVGEEVKDIEEALEKLSGKKVIFLTGMLFLPMRFKKSENYINKMNINVKDSEEYNNFIEGVYEYNNKKVPIFQLNGKEKGAYVLDLDKVESFIHYSAVDDEKTQKEISYSSFRLRDMKDVLDNKELHSKFVEGGLNPEDKTKRETELKNNVWFELYQRGELKLKEGAKVYRVSKSDIEKD